MRRSVVLIGLANLALVTALAVFGAVGGRREPPRVETTASELMTHVLYYEATRLAEWRERALLDLEQLRLPPGQIRFGVLAKRVLLSPSPRKASACLDSLIAFYDTMKAEKSVPPKDLRALLLVLAAVSALGTLAALLFTAHERVSRPLAVIVEELERLSSGDIDHPVASDLPAEWRTVAEGMDNLRVNLVKTRLQMKELLRGRARGSKRSRKREGGEAP